MGIRPAKCYRSTKNKPANTRLAVKVHKKNYIGAAPGLRTRQFNMGNPGKEFEFVLDLVTEEDVQIRDNAIEALRSTINRYLNRKIGKDAYFMKVRIYPHHILRENKQGQGAGADRTNTGMSHPFGKPVGRAARTKAGTIVMSLLITPTHLTLGKEALLRAKSKLPCKVRVKVHTDTKSIGTKPKRTRDEVKEEKVAETAEEGKEGEKAAGKEGAKKDAKGGEKKDAGKKDAKSGEKKADAKAAPKKK